MTDVTIITESLGGSALSRALQRGEGDPSWLALPPRSAADWRARAERRRQEQDWSGRLSMLAPAFAASGKAAERLERVRRDGGIAVTTGQQPGLFGGPIYTWSKAVSTIALADAIERETGVPTVPVFWAATDDADFAEGATTIVARPGGADVLRATEAPPAGTPMTLAPLGALDAALRGLREASGSTADARALDAVRRAYDDPTRSIGDAFVQAMRALLEPLGMPVLDASHAAVHAASRDVIHVAMARASQIEQALAARTAALRLAGHRPQVDDVAGLSLVFARAQRVKRRLSVAEASASVSGVLTPNVLLRPVVEQAILPTVAYVAGPGELAYFAQTSAVAAAMDVSAPLALPRWSCTLVEPHVAQLLARYEAAPADLAAADLLESRLARRAMSDATDATLREVRTVIGALPDTLRADALALGLDRAVQGASQSLLHRLDRLERRLVAGIKRRDDDRARDVATLRGALHPHGVRQERALNLIPLLARHGLGLLNDMREAARPHADALVAPSTVDRLTAVLTE